MALQIRRGLEADRSSITPIEGELLYVTDTKEVYIGDGTTAGGTLVSGDLVDDTSPQLGGNLDLNGNDITGTGNISIDGTITATGNINLGDGSADNVSVLGSLTTSLTPLLDSSVDIGSPSNRWRNGYYTGLQVDGEIRSVSVNSDIIADDSTVVFDASNGSLRAESLTGTFTGNVVGNTTGYHTGDITGSVFGDDSTLLVDGVDNKLNAPLHANIFDQSGDKVFDFPTGEYRGNVNGLIYSQDDVILLDTLNSNLNILQILPKNSDTARVTITRPDNGDILDLRIESKQTRSRVNINTVDLTGDLSSYSGYYGSINFGYQDSTTDRSDCTIRGRSADMRMAHDTQTALISDESKYFTLKEGNFGFGTYTPAQKLDVRGNGVFTGNVTAAAFNGSVFADDSTLLVDGVNGKLVGDYENGTSTIGISMVRSYDVVALQDLNTLDSYVNGTLYGGATANIKNLAIGSTAPTDSTGADGDRAGMIAFDSTSIYYCIANWASPGTANIWVKQDWGTTGAWS